MAKKPVKEKKPKKEKPVLAEPIPPPGHIPAPGQPMPTVRKPLNVQAMREAVWTKMAVSGDPRVRLMHGHAAQMDAFANIIAAGASIRDVSAWVEDCRATSGEFMRRVFEGA